MASSRVVGYTEARPTTYKPGPLARVRHATKKKVQGFVGKHKKTLEQQKERFWDNLNFSATNVLMTAVVGAIGVGLVGVAAEKTGVGAKLGNFIMGNGWQDGGAGASAVSSLTAGLRNMANRASHRG